MQSTERHINSQQSSRAIAKHPSPPALKFNITKTYKASIMQTKKALKPTKGSLNKRSSMNENYMNSNSTKRSAKLSNQYNYIPPNERNKSKLKKQQLLTSEPSILNLDENINPNVHAIATHRFSDIYQPSKFIKSSEVNPEISNYIHERNSANNLHSRYKSDTNIIFSLPLNDSIIQKSEVDDFQEIYNVDSKYGEHYATFQESIDQKNVSRLNCTFDYNYKTTNDSTISNWSFQTQYRAEKSKIQVIFIILLLKINIFRKLAEMMPIILRI